MRIYIKTPARLQMGLIDLNGDLGRIFGGLGVGIDYPNVVLEAEEANGFSVVGEQTELVRVLAKRFSETYKVQPRAHLLVRQTIPEHVGLGSGTQLALAVAVALAKLSKIESSTQELASVMERMQRTGVGTTIFERGGFVVDGGKPLKNGSATKSPPLIFDRPFPADWYFVVAIPRGAEGLANDAEKTAFNRLPRMPAEDVGRICRLIMMKLVPSLVEHEIEDFGEALTEIQVTIGDYFAQVQGGRYSSPATADTIKFMQQIGACGVGQSSWGPTCYGLFRKDDAEEAKFRVQAFLKNGVGGQAFKAEANNRGAYIRLTR
jgi:beta-ribofuranosylaminobenzene 5'-phosphate synthase